jgi:hypothetical protein
MLERVMKGNLGNFELPDVEKYNYIMQIDYKQ